MIRVLLPVLSVAFSVGLVYVGWALWWPRDTSAQLASRRARALYAAERAYQRGDYGMAEEHRETAEALLRLLRARSGDHGP